jgi:conjugal transfer/entry exclusion protein
MEDNSQSPSYDLEQQIDAAFSNLHRSIARITSEVFGSTQNGDTRTLQTSVKESLANIRANIRVLEELAEEQDR